MQLTCVSCSRRFEVTDDDPLWSVTTEVQEGVEVITARHIEPSCPHCGAVSAARYERDVLVGQGFNRVDVIVDPPSALADSRWAHAL